MHVWLASGRQEVYSRRVVCSRAVLQLTQVVGDGLLKCVSCHDCRFIMPIAKYAPNHKIEQVSQPYPLQASLTLCLGQWSQTDSTSVTAEPMSTLQSGKLQLTCLLGLAPPMHCCMVALASWGNNPCATLTIWIANSLEGTTTRACNVPASCALPCCCSPRNSFSAF